MQESDLLRILDQSRNWNQVHGISGMLLYLEGRFLGKHEGRFMQVLEGSQKEVKNIFEQIKRDKRHHSIIVLKQASIPVKNFETWTMGFKSIALEACKTLPGYFSLDDVFLKSDQLQQSSLPLNFLKSFYEINMNNDSDMPLENS